MKRRSVIEDGVLNELPGAYALFATPPAVVPHPLNVYPVRVKPLAAIVIEEPSVTYVWLETEPEVEPFPL